jgi:catechol 2,3-dioxygenase-like lactoylglutathione lyase family enzyme
MIKHCIPVIPSADLQKSLHFWADTLGLTVDQEMYQEKKLVGCMVHNANIYFWLNQRAGDPIPTDYEGIRLYWTPIDIKATRERLKDVGYTPSEIEQRDYGQTEFVVTDNDGYSHCFGVATQHV